jgi:serine/threonine protein kinase/formylglycine-generating enzyme required for sulfatase activity
MTEWNPPDEIEEYRLIRLLGRGAMGRVYLAHDTLLDRHVAVKFVDASEGAAAKSRVFEEARAIARLQHPNVVGIYRVAEAAGHPYLVSEYVRGRSLDQIDRPVARELLLTLALDLARGLAAAHRSGVLHRDVKPANAILTDDVRGKLLDFGLARVIDASMQEPVAAPPRERTAPRTHVVDQTMDVSPRREQTSDATEDSINAPLTSSALAERASPEHIAAGSPPRGEGTPLYMAPELWRGEPATRRSDLYALGILLYELVAGNAPHRGLDMAALGDRIQNADIPRLSEVMPTCDPKLAAIIDRLVERDAGARFPSADALLTALEECAAPVTTLAVPAGNPYRGLAVFEAAHGALFFGRRNEIRELVDRVSTEPLVVVGGDSGTGKSSVCRAGVLPFLVENEGWTRVDLAPGRWPVQSFAAALSAWSGVDEATLAEMMRDAPASVARAIRKHILAAPGRKLLLFVDQLEELLTISEIDEAKIVAATLAALAVHTPSVRVLATARSDFLSRLATLPLLGDELGRALYFLRPLVGERLREAVVRPAAAKGVTFESDALVDALVEQTEHAPGGLPLLQFALAELWEVRDATSNTIRADALVDVGGVAGALARHADRLLAGLDAQARDAARRLLLRLVTADGTRAPRSESELLSEGREGAAERRALEALVRGRIVVANDAQHGAYEIAHEALLASWATFQEWRQKGAAERATHKRIELATAEWDRAGRPRDLLWKRRQLAEARSLPRDELAPHEVAFLEAGRRVQQQRLFIGIGVTALLASGALAVGLHLRTRAELQVGEAVAEQLQRAEAQLGAARAVTAQIDAGRASAFELFQQDRWQEANERWRAEVDGRAADELKAYRDATSLFKSALAIDPDHTRVRTAIADLYYARLVIAEKRFDTAGALQFADEVRSFDNGRYASMLAADARVTLSVTPRTAQISIERAGAATERWSGAPAMAPGHVVFVAHASGYATTRMPVLLERGKAHQLVLDLLPAESVPPDMVYIPRGAFLTGSRDETDLRSGYLNAAPLHVVSTGAYLIGRHEVTVGEWIAFLDALPLAHRRARTPPVLEEVAPRRWRFKLARDSHTYVAEMGQPFRYQDRSKRAEQDWLRFPISGIVVDDVTQFAAWLHETKRVPNARMCSAEEWERAARGADDRTYPHGETLAHEDANIDETYGRAPLAYGPDEVGSYPRSASPFGVFDMAGNVWELTGSAAQPVLRGGSWYNPRLSSRIANREPTEPSQRDVEIGARICATPVTAQQTDPSSQPR